MGDAILVTGATGFVGTHLVRELCRQGRRVYPHSTAKGDIATCRFEVDDVGHVFHLAGKSFVPDSWTSPVDFYAVNVLGTANVLDFCRRRDVPLTFVSSYVYGIPISLPIREDHPVQPLNPYSHSKILAEETVRYFGAQFGVRSSIVRPFNVYGPGQDSRFLIPTIIQQALDPRCDRITLRDVRPRRDYIHVRDLVSLLISTLAGPSSGVYNAGSGTSVSIPDLVTIVNRSLGGKKPLHSIDQVRLEEVLDVVADISRARKDLNWEPRIELGEGLPETAHWMQRQFVRGV
jgi:nucleoside-diphosphate-sugar epimerase